MKSSTYSLRLQENLESESRRFVNEWLFLWYHIGGDQIIEIDGFDGRMIRYRGIHFSDSAREAYWSAFQRYLRTTVSETYASLEAALQDARSSDRKFIVTETQSLLSSFTRTLITVATAQDRTMRGNGTDFPLTDAARAEDMTTKILARIEEHDQAMTRRYKLNNRIQSIEHRLGEYPNIFKLVLSLGAGGLLAALGSVTLKWLQK